MAQRRARLSDNDPLSPTDRVLAGFERHSKKTSQLVNQPESQVDASGVGQQESKLVSQEVENPTSHQVNKSKIQEVEKPIAEEVNQSTSQKAVKSSSQVAVKPEEPSAPIPAPDPKEVNQPTSQPASKPTIRKATFQISDAVLQQLDTFHLQLQLELGKANAPYKEVIVEEAIARILTQALSDRASLITTLQERQQQREA
ncbi:hypothetical protein [Leptolyngbya sp. FACHB-711]|uniref:hypothetical protein n=1 Tax=unclassified Leptolyngbya TaxID=2650499 RepID=UPI0016854B8B|nr:hypothetical protein [Leptolyngbya sp. FACHB-711]MBD1848518.1 hypothetical protein [Cyanobacteria bacterium FACHB-502]MBD2025491.1 hypothetical protein [Leptolyngbya sp. FACHB-711]